MASAFSKDRNHEKLKLRKRIEQLTEELQRLNAEALSQGSPLIGIKKNRKKEVEKEIENLESKLKSLNKPAPTRPKKAPVPNPPPVDPNQHQDRPWDEKQEGSFLREKQKQMKLKAYYDSFPNIDDDNNMSELNEVTQYTNSILSKLPSGDVTERSTACHVLNRICESQNLKCLFFDSTHDNGLHDASAHLADTNSDDRPFVVKLNSIEGLGGNKAPKTEHGAIRLVQTLDRVIEDEKPHPVIDDIRIRLSKVHNVDARDIVIKTVYVGTFNIVYTVKNLAKRAVQAVIKIKHKLEEQFEQFVSAKIHPLLFRPAFDITFFDKFGNKTFETHPTHHMIGPPGKQQEYTPPAGWTRFGLKVLNKYFDGNQWLEPFKDSHNWYRAYHGTGNAKAIDFTKCEGVFDPKGAPVDAMASIYENGFREARIAAYGPGVYCSPNPLFPEKSYVTPIEIDTKEGKKRFKCMLQVAVNPDGVDLATKDIWVVTDPKNIRPYGILIKEA